ncbi:MAG: Sapep family Mn(2+)-dependent dipeptidase [Chthonomonas sp.]|nr:Sapep family Mn(2+)-dependent dipeptidase [Chthonomonas sp.]
MTDPVVTKLHAWLKEHESELLADYQTMLRFPSIEGPAEPNAPFGRANRDALDFALAKANEWGMKTTDLEGFCGFAEFGSGERMVGVFGHLDVVPVGPGWKFEPFDATIHEGYVYARGATDDKGPTMAAFYAARALQVSFPEIGSRIRIVFGCDEESGFECIHRYTRTEESPTFGIAPDAGWPLIHAEKGITSLVVRVPKIRGDMELLELTGGQRPNIVIDSGTAKVRVSAGARAHVEAKIADGWDRNIATRWDGDVLSIDAVGKAAHGSWPFGGDNAIIRILRFLMDIAPLSVQEAFVEMFELTYLGGEGLGIDGRDDISYLTCNLGVVTTEETAIDMLFNIRYPVTWKGEDLFAKTRTHLATLALGAELVSTTDSTPLYFPLDHPLVKTVCEVYVEETGDTSRKPGVMGGGTYARAVPNAVAIGTGWLGDGEAHQTDERCAVESLFKMSRIYAHILYRLATLP